MGPLTAQLAERILAEKPHPEQGYRSCMGLISLGRRYGKDRLEAAAQRALQSLPWAPGKPPFALVEQAEAILKQA